MLITNEFLGWSMILGDDRSERSAQKQHRFIHVNIEKCIVMDSP